MGKSRRSPAPRSLRVPFPGSGLCCLCAALLLCCSVQASGQERPDSSTRRTTQTTKRSAVRNKRTTPVQPKSRYDLRNGPWNDGMRTRDTLPPSLLPSFLFSIPPAGIVRDTNEWHPPLRTDQRWTRVLSERAMSPEEAVAELLALLKKHPEFRRTILREILAGDGMKTIKPLEIEEYLARAVKAMRFKSSYEYELMKRGGGGYTGPYDPIYGRNRDKTLGFQVNVFELLKFVKGLVGE